ncbi:MAG: diadenylate cyclase [Pseudohongiellaceae bacterium]|jgi:diadenylate cyclase
MGLVDGSVLGIQPFSIEFDWSKDGLSAAIEIGLLFCLFYAVLKFLHGTRGLAVLKGVGVIILLVVALLNLLEFTFALSFPRLDAAGAVILPLLLVMLVIVFQPELRTGLTRVSERSGRSSSVEPNRLFDFAESIVNLATKRTGVLVVFECQVGLAGLQNSGVPLDAALSGALIESVFYPNSPLHDGAVIVRNGRVSAAGCMLPLTGSTSVSRDLGTRHRAAMGVTEESDAVVVVVSEETGRVSVARRGLLHTTEGRDNLLVTLADFLSGTGVIDEAREPEAKA